MSGFPIYLLVSIESLDCGITDPMNFYFFVGRPPVMVDELGPLVPDRAGVKISFMSWLRLLVLGITHLSSFWAVRSTVVDPRIAEVPLSPVSPSDLPFLTVFCIVHH